jgi:phage shock protein PspC (stress-responsive transcriptional regulator)
METDVPTHEEGQEEMRRCPYCQERIHRDAVKCRFCRSSLDPTEESSQPRDAFSGKMFLGVSTGLARKYQIPVTVVRLTFVLLTLFHGFGILLYLILWAIMPGIREGDEPKATDWVRTVRRFFWAVKKAFNEEIVGNRGDRPGNSELDKTGEMNTAESR